MAILSLGIAMPARAQDSAPAAPPADNAAPKPYSGDWAIAGVGAIATTQYEGSDDYELLPVPAAVGSVGGVAFTIIGGVATADLIAPRLNDHWRATLGPVAAYGVNRAHLSVITDRRVRALGRVKPSVELGGSLGLVGNGVLTSAYDRLSLSLTYRHDVNGAHDGALFRPSMTYLMPVSRKAMLLFVAQASHADSHYAQTYFGITPAQGTASGLAPFSARGGWKDWTLAAAGDISLTGNLQHGLSLVGGVSYTRLMNDFATSPITSVAGSPNQWMGGLGLAYAF